MICHRKTTKQFLNQPGPKTAFLAKPLSTPQIHFSFVFSPICLQVKNANKNALADLWHVE
jgi:hypothetical protein